MKSPFIDFAVLETETNADVVSAYNGELKNPFVDPDISRVSDEDDTQTDIPDKLSNEDDFPDDVTKETEPFEPETSDESWDQMGESIEYEIQPAETAKAVADQLAKYFKVAKKTINSYDVLFKRKWSERFKELVEWVAAQVNLNPGLVATNLVAETNATDYLGGKISSFIIGTDDFYDKRTDVERKVPAFKTISWKRDPYHLTDVNENSRTVNTVFFKTGKDAALASAVYLKHGEVILQEEASTLGKSFDAIPLQSRFAFLRLAFNAGLGRSKKNLNEYLLKNKEVLILKPQRKAGPQRRATIRTAQAIYLSEVYFGLPLTLEGELNEASERADSSTVYDRELNTSDADLREISFEDDARDNTEQLQLSESNEATARSVGEVSHESDEEEINYGEDSSESATPGSSNDFLSEQEAGSSIVENENLWWVRHRVLKKGAKGKDVEKLQYALLKNWGIPVKINGVFGDNTVKAVVDFQKKLGLQEDGIVGPFVHAMVFESDYRYAIKKPPVVIQTVNRCWAAALESAVLSWKDRVVTTVANLVAKYKSFLSTYDDITYPGFHQIMVDLNGGELSFSAGDFRIEPVRKLMISTHSHLLIVHHLTGSVAHTEVIYGFGVLHGEPYILVMDPLYGAYSVRKLNDLQALGGYIVIAYPK